MKKLFFSNVAILLLMFSGVTIQSLYAAEMGGYAGFSLGSAEVKTLNVDDSAYKIYGGFNSTDNLGVEIAYIQLGKFNNGSALVDTYGVAFDLVGYFPVGQNVDVFGKFGLFSWTADIGIASDDGTDPTYGFGVNIGLANRLSVRAEWENFTDVSGSDISMLSAGVTYHF